jgi:ATP-binding cassette subfamily C protein CydC
VSLLAPERRRAAGAAALQVLTLAAGVGLMGTSAWLLSKAALHPSIAAISVAVVGVRAFGVARATLRYLERLASHDVTLRLLARLRVAVYRALVPLAPARLAGYRSGDLLGRVIEDVAALETLYVRVIGPSLAAVAVAALVVLVLWPFGPPLAAAAVLGLAASGTAFPWLAWRLGRGPGRRLASLRGDLAARLVDAVQGQADLLAFGREADHAAAVGAVSRQAVGEQQRLARASALGGSLTGLGADLTAVAVLALAIPSVRAGDLDGVHLAVVTLVTLAAFEAVAALPAAWLGLGAVRESAGRLFEVTDQPPAVAEPAGPDAGPAAAPAAAPRALEARDLRFTYPGEPRPALDGVSLRLEPGRRVAVVGPSGSGKSTLVHLLLRFWDVPPGSLLLDGGDARAWPSDRVRGAIAFAAQRAHLFTGTLRENLALAAPGAAEAALRAVLATVRLDDLVARRPEGLDTWIGEQGLQLSGGERQRLALARALLKDAPFLLLDEPTAHLDALTERDVMREIVRAGEGRATLLVTHRLVSLEAFDEVLVLERGRVAERGRARDLARSGGTFARLLALRRSTAALGDDAFAEEYREGAHGWTRPSSS